MIDTLRGWVAHMEWADHRMLEALRASGGEPAQALEIMAHVLGAEHVWLQRMRGEMAEVAVWPDADLDACAELAARNALGYRELLDGFDVDALRESARYRNSDGLEFASRLADMLSQSLLHASYHRGQVALLLRSAGFEPAATDYIAFVRGAPAAKRRA